MKWIDKYYFVIVILMFYASDGFSQCPTVAITGAHVTCYGNSNGSVTATVSGGTGLYSYSWSTGATLSNTTSTSQTISGLSEGVYSVNVTDMGSGCSGFNLFVVNQPEQLILSSSVTNVNCFGESTGAIDLSVTGGTAAYSYSWSNSSSSQDLSGITAGTYTVNLTDAKGCTASHSATVTQTSSALESSVSSSGVSCQLGTDGSADLTVWGGYPPYYYSWNSGLYSSQDITDLNAGTYSVVITDALGCMETNSVLISEPAAISSSVSGVNVLCYGENTGEIDLGVTGGSPPYSFNWSNASFTFANVEDLTGIPADNYSVIITDANGCTNTNSITITQPSVLSSSIAGTNISCYGYTDGTVSLSVSGGAAPYSYVWTNSNGPMSNSTANLNNLPAESYSVTITDFNGCISSNTITLNQPSSGLSLQVETTDVNCFGDNDGTADLSVFGGTSPYTFNWSNGSLDEDQPALFSGTYTITVIDANSCVESQNITISQPAAALTGTTTTSPVDCFGNATGNMDVTISGGTLPYAFTWINSQYSLSETAEDLTGFIAEIYTVTVTDSKGCVLVLTDTITQPDLLVSSIQITDVLCYNESTGSLDMIITGGVSPYQYLWSNGNITEDIQNIPAGNYSVNVTDANGCLHSNNAVISQPASALSGSYYTEDVTCNGYSNGEIYYTSAGGTAPHNFLWSNGSTVQNIFSLTAGNYDLTITDGNGCILNDVVTVSEPDPVVISAVVTPVNCFGEENGSINISMSGGTASYDFEWMDQDFMLSAITEDLINFPAGEYTVTATDSFGCASVAVFTITQPAALSNNVAAANVSCAGGTNGTIDITMSGGTPSYSYLWSDGQTTEDANNLAAGTYTISITDANGCVVSASYTLSEPEPMLITAQVSEVSCSDQADGRIYITVTGGTGLYSYLWSNGDTDELAEDLPGGEHSVVVSDASGCTADSTFSVDVNPAECIDIPNAFSPNGDGINDTWMIHNIGLYDACVMKIFDLWGQLIFESTGYTSPWDGTFHGKSLPSATYYYILDLGNGTEPFSGSITLLQ